MNIKVITPDKSIFEGEIENAKFPGKKGEFEVLNNHAPLISTLGKGKLSFKTSEKTHDYQVNGGVVEILNNEIVVLLESVEE